MNMATAKQIAARKKFSEMAKSGKLTQLRKKAAKKNPANNVSEEVSAQMRKGKPQKQAVAIALEMQRQGKLKKNPMSRVAETIFQQLGASKFAAITGAKNFVYGDDMLMFSIPRNMSPYNKVRITYDSASDLYEMEFAKVTSLGEIKKSQSFSNVYAEQLRELFRMITGMETSLGTMGRRSNPTPGQRTRSRTKLIQNGNGERKSNPMQAYAIKCSRSGRTLGYADSLPMAKSMATAIANERMIPVQIVKA